MKKLNVSFIDNGAKEDAILKIKDDSFSITTSDNSIIKIPYSDIKDYDYSQDERLTIKRKHSSDIVIEVSFDTTLINTLKEIVKNNETHSQPTYNREKEQTKEPVKAEDSITPPKDTIVEPILNQTQNDFTNTQKSNISSMIVALLVICGVIFGIYSIGSSIFGSESSSDANGLSTDRSDWVDAGYVYAESNAKKDIPEDAYVWGTLKASELTCETIGVSDKVIVVVKCSTTNDELIKHYGSATIYYGFQRSADGTKYWHYASKDRNEVIQKVK